MRRRSDPNVVARRGGRELDRETTSDASVRRRRGRRANGLVLEGRTNPDETGSSVPQGAEPGRAGSATVLFTDPQTGEAPAGTRAAMCVQDVDVQRVLQFTLIHAANCALHRHTSRVIHRIESFFLSTESWTRRARATRRARTSQ